MLALLMLAGAQALHAEDGRRFVGVQACAGCHAAQAQAWRGSHHDLAMQVATAETVLGDFDDAIFRHGDVAFRFFRRDGRFFVNTDGLDGTPADFEIRYTFGVHPLQQYLIALPGGRLQALGIAWDSRPASAGGQRWFHLYPETAAGDRLHWTGPDQTWNFMCAECHSTGVRKNYDAATDTYATTWAEIDVGCEACHGPGSAHVAWAERRDRSLPRDKDDDGLIVHFDERRDVHWTVDPSTGTARRSRERTSAKELETCGMCHSRSSKIAEGWRPGRPLLQTHLPALLEPGLFEADGMMRDEVFTYAPFRQSRMFLQGVSCSECHDPHSLRLVAEGNGVCAQCHDPGKYDAASHHRHADGSQGSACAACHMPQRTYMRVDARHDHGFRVPRPDQSVAFGVPNACNDCHRDRDPAWAAAAVERWFGPARKGVQGWTATLAALRDGKPGSQRLLLELAASAGAPSIVRATALDAIGQGAAPGQDAARGALAAARQAAGDADPLVRRAALRAVRALPVADVWPLAERLLDDPVRGVRIEAGWLLAPMPQDRLNATDRQRLARAIADYVAAQRLNADRPEARVFLGDFFMRQGQVASAVAEYEGARTLDPAFIPAYLGLAQAHASGGRERDGEAVLRDGLRRLPEAAELRLALGLSLVRQGRGEEALGEFAAAVRNDPGTPRYAYVYAIALNSAGRTGEAIASLEASHARNGTDRETLLALVTINAEAGRSEAAVGWAEKLAAVDPAAAAVLDRLRRAQPLR